MIKTPRMLDIYALARTCACWRGSDRPCTQSVGKDQQCTRRKVENLFTQHTFVIPRYISMLYALKCRHEPEAIDD